ncbi:unnamed protein product [Darwinula stevensoni]|uniref:Uncharacterized protein n=1 Tax=Darwinula stevensoni TaxID=69355 RepID=A0A7R8XIC7_9CRUS|nr:unnamed protein product [Darwinula stevensoni]CAG0894204.1 unnamed protein product [Darwinula stevensoni]
MHIICDACMEELRTPTCPKCQEVFTWRKTSLARSLFPREHAYAVIGSKSNVSLPSSITTVKDLFRGLWKPEEWILSDLRHLKICDLPENINLVSFVNVELDNDEVSSGTATSATQYPPDSSQESNTEEYWETESGSRLSLADSTTEEFVEDMDET